MKKYLFLAILLAAFQTHAGDFKNHTEVGELVENETSFKEFCREVKNAHDLCGKADEYMLAGVLVNDDEAVNAVVKKSDFKNMKGKKVRVEFEGINPVGTIVEVM